MNQLILFLQSCAKNQRLQVFWALVLLGPLPVTLQEIMRVCALQDYHAISKALKSLQSAGLALSTGARNLTNWQISPGGLRLAMDFFQVLNTHQLSVTGQTMALPLVENLLTENAPPKPIDVKDPVQPGRIVDLLLTPSTIVENLLMPVVESESVNNINSYSITSAPEKNSDAETQRRFGVVLKRAGVFPNVATGLLEQLAERPDYLPHLIGHLAVIKSGRAKSELGYQKGAVYIRDCIQGHSPADVLPPAELDFEAALVWANNGGVTQAELDQRAAEEAAYLDALANLPEPKPAPAAFETHSPLWKTVLDQLALEMPKSTFDTWVRETRLLSTDSAADGGATYTIGAPNSYAKDWLENRLTSSIKRALSTTTGRANSDVRFVVLEREKEK